MRPSVLLFAMRFVSLVSICSAAGLSEGLSAEQRRNETASEDSKTLELFPKIQFDELSHDFGKTLQRTTLKHVFIFRNTGRGTLRIEKVKAG